MRKTHQYGHDYDRNDHEFFCIGRDFSLGGRDFNPHKQEERTHYKEKNPC